MGIQAGKASAFLAGGLPRITTNQTVARRQPSRTVCAVPIRPASSGIGARRTCKLREGVRLTEAVSVEEVETKLVEAEIVSEGPKANGNGNRNGNGSAAAASAVLIGTPVAMAAAAKARKDSIPAALKTGEDLMSPSDAGQLELAAATAKQVPQPPLRSMTLVPCTTGVPSMADLSPLLSAVLPGLSTHTLACLASLAILTHLPVAGRGCKGVRSCSPFASILCVRPSSPSPFPSPCSFAWPVPPPLPLSSLLRGPFRTFTRPLFLLLRPLVLLTP